MIFCSTAIILTKFSFYLQHLQKISEIKNVIKENKSIIIIIIDIVLGREFISFKECVVWIAFYGMCTMVVNYVLISNNGVLGVAKATIVTSFITFIGVWYLSQRLYTISWFGKEKKV